MTTFVQHVIDAISLGSLYALIALGIALIFGIMQLLNFAHGELLMVTGYAVLFVSDRTAFWPLVLVSAMCLAILFAIVMERVAFRPVRGAEPSTLLVTSFAVSYVLQNLVIVIVGARPKGVSVPPNALAESVTIGGIDIAVVNLAMTIVAFGLLGGLALVLKATRIGIQMRATAEDFVMARLSGVRADMVIAVAFGVSGLLAGVAAILFVAQTGTLTPKMGLDPVLIAFVATILGGMGSLLGAVIGAYAIGAISVALQTELPLFLRSSRDAFLYTTVILILLVRPQGLVVAKHTRTRV